MYFTFQDVHFENHENRAHILKTKKNHKATKMLLCYQYLQKRKEEFRSIDIMLLKTDGLESRGGGAIFFLGGGRPISKTIYQFHKHSRFSCSSQLRSYCRRIIRSVTMAYMGLVVKSGCWLDMGDSQLIWMCSFLILEAYETKQKHYLSFLLVNP